MKKINVIFILICALIFIIASVIYIVFTGYSKTHTTLIHTTHTSSIIDRVLLKYLPFIRDNEVLINSLSYHSDDIVSNLWVDKTEVLQGDLYKFISWSKVNNTLDFRLENTSISQSFSSDDKLSGKSTVAANGVDFYTAYTYCRASGGRLLNSSEFYALATANNTIYPWGNNFSSRPWPYLDATLNTTTHPKRSNTDISSDGIYNLSSVVSEWTMGEYPLGLPKIMGSNGYLKPHQLYAIGSFNISVKADHYSKYIGFRCAYNNKPLASTPWKAIIDAIHITHSENTHTLVDNSQILPLLKYLDNIDISLLKKYTNTKDSESLIMSNTEVTVKQYTEFLNNILVKSNIYKHSLEPNNHSRIPLNWHKQQRDMKKPITGVSYWNAYEFSRWIGGKLPRYKDFVTANIHYPTTTNINAKKQQNTPQPVSNNIVMHHINDNVSEWTRTADITSLNNKVILYGSSYLIDKDSDNIGFYRSLNPSYKLPDIGFRVVW